MKLILVSQVFRYWLHCLIQDLRIPSFLTVPRNHCLKHHLFTLSTATLLVTLPIVLVENEQFTIQSTCTISRKVS